MSQPHNRLPTHQKKVSVTLYPTPEQADALRRLNEATRVPVAEYVREGIDLVLKQHAAELEGVEP